jgi:hypothetical protein
MGIWIQILPTSKIARADEKASKTMFGSLSFWKLWKNWVVTGLLQYLLQKHGVFSCFSFSAYG